MRGLSGVGASLGLLVAVGCAADEATRDQAVPPPAGSCPAPVPSELPVLSAGTQVFARGLVAPPNSVTCTAADTGMPQLNCTHDSSSVVALPGGGLAVAWYHGVGDKSLDSHLLWARRAPADGSWSTPAVLYDDPKRAEGGPALWTLADGSLATFFVTFYGSDWDDARPFVIHSGDGGTSWSAPLQLNDRCWMVRQRPLLLRSGTALLPLYDTCLDVPVFMHSGDGGQSWQPSPDVTLVEHFQQIQPAIIQRSDGTVVALTRDSDSPSRIAQMASRDDGMTWSASVPVALPSPTTGFDQLRLPSGHVVVVFNNSLESPFPLTAALSLDEGKSFVAMRDLLADCPDGPGKCAYTTPSIAYSPADGANGTDGTLWVTYTHNRQTIGWVHFNEAWLAAGQSSALIKCTAHESCTIPDHTCQRLCRSDADCLNQAVPMQCAATGLCQPICPDTRPVTAHCEP